MPRRFGRRLALASITILAATSATAAFARPAIEQLASQDLFNREAQRAAVASSLEGLGDRIYRWLCPVFSDCVTDLVAVTADSEARPPAPTTPASATTSFAATFPAPAPLPSSQQAPPEADAEPLQQTIVQQPVIERVIEQVRTVVSGGVSEAFLDARLLALDTDLTSRMHSLAAANSSQTSNVYNVVSSALRIENLDDVKITNSRWTGGSISAASISGTIAAAIDTASAIIASLTATELVATNATTTNLYVSGSTSLSDTTVSGDLTLASLSGPLHANAGLLSATTSIGVLYGGTGLTAAPSYGQLLLGQSDGTYQLAATSSLGIAGGSSLWSENGNDIYYNTGTVGIGTSTPYAKLSVVGPVVAEYFHATSTTATSTFSGALTLSGATFLQTAGAPTQVATNEGAESGRGLVIAGNYAYVGFSASPQFRVFDISDPNNPSLAGGLNLSETRSVHVSGRYAYLTTSSNTNSFAVVDVSNPSAPTKVGNIPITGSAFDAVISGAYAYVATGDSSRDFIVVDVSNPSAPTQIASIDLPNTGRGITVAGKYAYVTTDDVVGSACTEECELFIIDISTPSAPVVVSSLDLPDEARDVVVVGRYAYVATHASGGDFHIVDVSDPAAPAELANLELGMEARSVFVAGRYAYVAGSSTNKVSIIDIASSTAPVEVQTASLSGSGNVVHVHGKYMYVTVSSGVGLVIFDISGADLPAARIGALAVTHFDVADSLVVSGKGEFNSGLTIGSGGIASNGALFVTATTTPSYFAGNVGIGTTSPWAKLSVEATAGTDSFAVGSTTSTYFVVNKSGNVGIGTASPSTKLHLASTATNNSPHLYLQNTNGATSGGFGPGLILDNGATGKHGYILTQGQDSASSFKIANYVSPWTSYLEIDQSGNVGIGTTSPWRKLSVTGTVGFDGLTGAVGAGSLCLSSDKEVTYNSGSDACLSSLRETKHDIANLSLDGLTILDQLQPVSFVYNEGDGRTRYGFIAEDTAVVDPHLTTYSASGTLSGIDDRSILSLVVKALKELATRLTDLATTVANFAQRVTTRELCLTDDSGTTCYTRSQLSALLSQPAAAATPISVPSSPSEIAGPAPTASTTEAQRVIGAPAEQFLEDTREDEDETLSVAEEGPAPPPEDAEPEPEPEPAFEPEIELGDAPSLP